MLRVLMCGSRTFEDALMVTQMFEHLEAKYGIGVLIQGEARGADSLARDIGKSRGWEVESYPADWNRYGRRAGYVRNQQMLDEGKPELVIAFRSTGESRGTDMMVQLSKDAGIRTHVYTSDYKAPVGPQYTGL